MLIRHKCKCSTINTNLIGWACKTRFVQAIYQCASCGKLHYVTYNENDSAEWIKVMGDYKRLDMEENTNDQI